MKESIGRKSARMLSSLFIGRVVGLLVGVATFIIVARLLGPAYYGIYTLAIGIYSFIGAVGHFGIGTYFNKHIAESVYKGNPKKINEILSSGYYIIFSSAFVLLLIGVFGSGIISSYFKSQSLLPITVIISSFVLFFSMIYGTVYPALISLGRGKWTAYTILLVQIVNLIGSVSLIKIGLSYNGALLGLMLSYIFGFFMTIYFIGKAMEPFGGFRLVKININNIKKTLSFSFPMAANNLVSNLVNNFAVLLLGLFATSVLLGNYGAATKGLSMLQTFYSTMFVVLLPTFSAIAVKNSKIQNLFNKTIIYSLILIFPIVLYVGIFAKPLVYILVTNKYNLAPFYLFLISIGVIIGLPSLYISSFMVSKGRVIKVLKYNSISAAIEFLSLVMLVPYLKVVGVIISLFFIGSTSNDILFISGIYKNFNIRFDLKRLLKLIAASILFATLISVSLFFKSYWLEVILGFALSIVLYPILIAILGVVDRQFIKDILRFTKGIPFVEKIASYIVSYMNYFIR
ncbi:MAG: oligosaccharide flippase family protein [Candidatus Micrarchaeia archaeon]